ncbi:hypothetical protein V490_00137 [Pseudogymnoascus sp. VKM F-3557]|nr:hypothetical protein V490_00137 [Pseudogymnoascus sp. VKM F-3557]
MPVVLSNLVDWDRRSVGTEVVVNIPLPDRACSLTGHRPPHWGFPFSASPHSGFPFTVEAPSPSLPALSPSSPDVNGLDIPSLDAFGELTLESTTEIISGGEGHDLDRPENTGDLDNAHSDDDYSNSLSDVFIDFSGDFGDDFYSRTGEVDDGEASIINGEVC